MKVINLSALFYFCLVQLRRAGQDLTSFDHPRKTDSKINSVFPVFFASGSSWLRNILLPVRLLFFSVRKIHEYLTVSIVIGTDVPIRSAHLLLIKCSRSSRPLSAAYTYGVSGCFYVRLFIIRNQRHFPASLKRTEPSYNVQLLHHGELPTQLPSHLRPVPYRPAGPKRQADRR